MVLASLPFLDPPTDWLAVGIVLAIVGGFLLANSILFRHPRTLVEEHFGERTGRLATIREYIFHRVQVHLGFFFLLVGFGLQLYGHWRPLPPEAVSEAFPTNWIGAVLLAVVGLEIAGWFLSRWLFQRYVRAYFLEHPPSLETDMRLARELGELFSVSSAGDDTVQSYLAKIRHKIGLPVVPERGNRPFVLGEPEEELA